MEIILFHLFSFRSNNVKDINTIGIKYTIIPFPGKLKVLPIKIEITVAIK